MPLPDKAIFFSRFNSLNKEIFLNNGFKKEVHIVSKSLAFDVILRTSGIDLRGAQIFVQLFYDADSSAHHKPVDRVKAEPLTSRIFVVEESEKISCDIKINALSSQHEDSLFRLRVLVVEAGGTATQAFSDPIKVVSKPSLAKKSKKRDRPEGSEKLFLSSLEASTSKDLSEKSLFDVLSKMERQQQKIIEHLKGNSSKDKIKEKESESSLESAYRQFIIALRNENERPSKIRKLIKNTSASDLYNLHEFASALPSDKQNNLTHEHNKENSGQCSCSDCPFKKELDSWDKLYSTFIDPASF